MTVTKGDLKILSTESDLGVWRDVVQYNDICYIVAAHDLRNDPLSEILANLLKAPLVESYVMVAKYDSDFGEWVPKNECNESCATGVCNKRVLTIPVCDINKAYDSLLDYLNA
jgi:hypothetical protein